MSVSAEKRSVSAGITQGLVLEKLLRNEEDALNLQYMTLRDPDLDNKDNKGKKDNKDNKQQKPTTVAERLEAYFDVTGKIKDVFRAKRTISFNMDDARYIQGVTIDEEDGPKEILSKTMSVRSTLSIASSFAQRENEAKLNLSSNQRKFVLVGGGTSGKVFAVAGTDFAIKKAMAGGESLYHDFSTGLQMSHAVYTIVIPALQKEVAALRQKAKGLQDGATNLQKNATDAKERAATAQEKAAAAQERAAAVREGTAAVQQGSAAVRQRAAAVQQGAAAVRQGAVTAQKEADDAQKEADDAQEKADAAQAEADAAKEEADYFAALSVPRVPSYYSTHGFEQGKRDKWWAKYKEGFPMEDRKEAPLYEMERILPLPAIIRQNLIDQFWPDDAKDAAKIHPGNKDCLVRPYLGARYDRMTTEVRAKADERLTSLTNFPLYLNELRAIDAELPIVYAKNMALGLAAAHYGAGIHTLDVEFVIGSRRVKDTAAPVVMTKEEKRKAKNFTARQTNALDPEDPKNFDFQTRATQIWMIDYDKAGDYSIKLASETEDIKQLVKRSMAGNDPYYPRCDVLDREDFEVFAAFANAYIKAGRAIMKHKLPADWADIMGEDDVKRGLNRPKQFMREWYKLEMSQHGEGMRRLLTENIRKWEGMLKY